jgi:glyceraldehyde-3-phosphate dehydrogenase/erythrose-4-phosphate dehydrogenase
MTENTTSEQDKEKFLQEAIDMFESVITDPTQSKHAVFLVYDDTTNKLQTYTFNAGIPTLFMMVTSAYEMVQEAQAGRQLRTLN